MFWETDSLSISPIFTSNLLLQYPNIIPSSKFIAPPINPPIPALISFFLFLFIVPNNPLPIKFYLLPSLPHLLQCSISNSIPCFINLHLLLLLTFVNLKFFYAANVINALGPGSFKSLPSEIWEWKPKTNYPILQDGAFRAAV